MVRVNQSYLNDLIDLIDIDDICEHYTTVLNMLYDTEFISRIDEDINRIIDAQELRRDLQGPVIRPISVLEVMIALAKRCHEDIMYGSCIEDGESSTAYWFWIMMKNSGLDQLTDNYIYIEQAFNDIIKPILHRTYCYNGEGGFFPLHHPEMDQRFCELWYQLNAYLLENYPF